MFPHASEMARFNAKPAVDSPSMTIIGPAVAVAVFRVCVRINMAHYVVTVLTLTALYRSLAHLLGSIAHRANLHTVHLPSCVKYLNAEIVQVSSCVQLSRRSALTNNSRTIAGPARDSALSHIPLRLYIASPHLRRSNSVTIHSDFCGSSPSCRTTSTRLSSWPASQRTLLLNPKYVIGLTWIAPRVVR